MCGIAGIMYKGEAQTFDTGEALIRMLDGCQPVSYTHLTLTTILLV